MSKGRERLRERLVRVSRDRCAKGRYIPGRLRWNRGRLVPYGNLVPGAVMWPQNGPLPLTVEKDLKLLGWDREMTIVVTSRELITTPRV